LSHSKKHFVECFALSVPQNVYTGSLFYQMLIVRIFPLNRLIRKT